MAYKHFYNQWLESPAYHFEIYKLVFFPTKISSKYENCNSDINIIIKLHQGPTMEHVIIPRTGRQSSRRVVSGLVRTREVGVRASLHGRQCTDWRDQCRCREDTAPCWPHDQVGPLMTRRWPVDKVVLLTRCPDNQGKARDVSYLYALRMPWGYCFMLALWPGR